MKNFRKVIPMAVFALAIVGAFTTNAMTRSAKVSGPVQGYVRANPQGTICNESEFCTDDPGSICMLTNTSTQLWGKDGSGKCIVELHRVLR
jgi:hypothetical protein